jgi:subtilase family serine protease
VGGTDFADSYLGTNSTYWTSTNTAAFGSAAKYIPEIPWNNSCASVLFAKALDHSVPYGAAGFCNSPDAEDEGFLTVVGGSGGPSACATGRASVSDITSGTCKGYPKPSWQSLVGVPADNVRDIPDVSLFAANGYWQHYFVFCFSDTTDNDINGGTPCTGSPANWSGAGGTSFSSPIMAGIQALVNQKTGTRWGNPNLIYYTIARTEYGTTGNAACNSNKTGGPASSCVFYDVTLGDMDTNCKGTHNCYRPSGTNGVLSTSNTAYSPAYKTKVGWDFATGIGTVNAYNLVFSPKWVVKK